MTYQDVINNLVLPDKTGHCSAFSDFPLGKSGEGPPPMDHGTMERGKWRAEGRPTVKELYDAKKRHLLDLSSQPGQPAPPPVNAIRGADATIALPGGAAAGRLDKFVLGAVVERLRARRASATGAFRLMDRRGAGEVSREDFRAWLAREGLGLPAAATDALFAHFDQNGRVFDQNGRGGLGREDFVRLLNPGARHAQSALPDQDAERAADWERTRRGEPGAPAAAGAEVTPAETHPLARSCVATGEVDAKLLLLVQQALARKHRTMRSVFLKWDSEHDGCLTKQQVSAGLASLKLGLPADVIVRIVDDMAPAGADGADARLDFNAFSDALDRFGDIPVLRSDPAPAPPRPGSAQPRPGSARPRTPDPALFEPRAPRAARPHSSLGVVSEFTATGEQLFSFGGAAGAGRVSPAGSAWRSIPRDELRASWAQRMGARGRLLRETRRASEGVLAVPDEATHNPAARARRASEA